jgi:type I restriction enzyme S subunit
MVSKVWLDGLTLDNVLERIMGGGTPSRDIPEYYSGKIPWATVKDIKSVKIFDTIEHVTEEAISKSASNVVTKGTIVMASRMAVGKCFIAMNDMAINQDLKALITKPKLLSSDYLLQWLQLNKEKIESMGTGTTVKGIRLEQIRSMSISLPTLPEQRKITDILTSVDDAIEKTEAIIKQTEKVKKALMQQLLMKGSGQTEFKQTEIGEIPMEWELANLGSLFNTIQRPLKMDDEQEYQLVTVKRRQEGIVPRSKLKGKEILVKSQFVINGGDFLISKRQIVHGACEIVPNHFDGAIVSNEYHVLSSKGEYDLEYFRWFSRTNLIMKYFLLSSIGVHIEKMLFRIDDWFKRIVPLPPLEEQKRISNILNSTQDSINANKKYLNQLLILKQSLMQILLTGKVGVNVDEKVEVLV